MKAPNDGWIWIGEEILNKVCAGLGSVNGMNIGTELEVVAKISLISIILKNEEAKHLVRRWNIWNIWRNVRCWKEWM